MATLIIVAAVANLPLAMANVALPSIGAYFNAPQTQLNLVAVGYSLGLACTVLWLVALGDRYGRKIRHGAGRHPGLMPNRSRRRRRHPSWRVISPLASPVSSPC